MVDSAIHLLNNWGPVLFHSLSFHFSFAFHYSHNDYFEIETDCKRLKIELIHTKVKSTILGCKHVTNKIVLAQLILFASPLERVLGPLTLYEVVQTCLRNYWNTPVCDITMCYLFFQHLYRTVVAFSSRGGGGVLPYINHIRARFLRRFGLKRGMVFKRTAEV